MHRASIVKIATFLALGAGFHYVSHDPDSYVWNGNAEALQKVTPPLHTMLAVELLLLLGVGLLGLWLLTIQSSKHKAGALLLLLLGWVITERLAHQYLAVEQYTVWKYEAVTEEYQEAGQPAITEKLLPLFLQDVQSPIESTPLRVKLALALGKAQTQAAYPVLRTIIQDPHEDPYLQLHCLKALRLLQPQHFSAILASSSDSAATLYRRYEPTRL